MNYSEEELKAIKILENINIDKAGRTICNLLDGYKCTLGKRCYENEVNCQKEAIKVVLNLIEKQQKKIENSVSKDKIEEYLKEAEEKYQVYKKGVKDNEALKSGMWKYLGEVDILKRILGKQRNVVTLDNKLLEE